MSTTDRWLKLNFASCVVYVRHAHTIVKHRWYWVVLQLRSPVRQVLFCKTEIPLSYCLMLRDICVRNVPRVLLLLSLAPGYYAGLLSSGITIGHIFSAHVWGLVADRHGSRLVLIFGLVATVVLSIAFGYSKTFVYAFVCR